MQNKKTTIAGYLTLAAGVLIVLSTFLSGGDIGAAIQTSLVPAIAGLGLLGASDGGL